MATRRVKFIEFNEHNQPSLYSLSGAKERNATFREALKLEASFDTVTGIITIHNVRKDKEPEEVVLHLSGVRHVQLYPEPAKELAKKP